MQRFSPGASIIRRVKKMTGRDLLSMFFDNLHGPNEAALF